MALKYYIDNEEVSEIDYYDILFEHIIKEIVSRDIADPDFPVDGYTFEEMCEDDGVHYEAEGIDEDIYFDQLHEVEDSGRSEVTFYSKVFRIEESNNTKC